MRVGYGQDAKLTSPLTEQGLCFGPKITVVINVSQVKLTPVASSTHPKFAMDEPPLASLSLTHVHYVCTSENFLLYSM